ncbi:hypothetical protein [Streptosporangium sp. NPDC003464]
MSPKRVLPARPHGYCAGVDRAVQAAEKALDVYGPPVYVRKEIVHNRHVAETLKARGATRRCRRWSGSGNASRSCSRRRVTTSATPPRTGSRG